MDIEQEIDNEFFLIYMEHKINNLKSQNLYTERFVKALQKQMKESIEQIKSKSKLIMMNRFIIQHDLGQDLLYQIQNKMLEKSYHTKTEEVIPQTEALKIWIDKIEQEIQKSEEDLATSKQRGTHNSCWSYPSPHLSNACVERYQNILQTKTKIKDKYINLKTMLEERLKILQQEEAARKLGEEVARQQEKDNLVQELDDETIEIEIDVTGDVHHEAEEIYERVI